MQIAERRDGRNHILEHVGTARSDAELAVLMAEARRRLRPGQATLDLALGDEDSRESSRSGVITGKRPAVLWLVLSSVYDRLRFDVVDDDAFKELVGARIIEPTSKADSVRVLDEVGVEHASLRTMFRSLARSQERDYRSQVAAACFAHAAARSDISLCLYDVTTLYFKAEHEDELRQVGFSKERRVDPQIVVGLLVDRNGFPLEVGCYEGNKAETATIIPIVKQFQDRHGLSDLAVVADAGMLSTSNLTALDEAGLRFIVGSRVVKAPGDLASHFRWHGDAFADAQVIDTITPKRSTAAARGENDTSQRAEPVWDRAQHPGSCGPTPSSARCATARRCRCRPTAPRPSSPERRPRAHHGSSDHWRTAGPGRVLSGAGAAVGRVEGVRRQHPADVMPAGEVIASYHALWQVEASFRMSKTDLRARPMFHHTREAIEAHLTVVFTALAIARYLPDATGTSIKKIVHTLHPIQQITVRIAGYEHLAEDPLTPVAVTIVEALDLPPQ